MLGLRRCLVTKTDVVAVGSGISAPARQRDCVVFGMRKPQSSECGSALVQPIAVIVLALVAPSAALARRIVLVVQLSFFVQNYTFYGGRCMLQLEKRLPRIAYDPPAWNHYRFRSSVPRQLQWFSILRNAVHCASGFAAECRSRYNEQSTHFGMSSWSK